MCPIPEIARLGRTLASGRTNSWPTSTQAEPATHHTEAINGIIELGRRTARGYRNPTNYQPRMPLTTAGLDASTHTQLGRATKTQKSYIGLDTGVRTNVNARSNKTLLQSPIIRFPKIFNQRDAAAYGKLRMPD